jgi:hypothetical protein
MWVKVKESAARWLEQRPLRKQVLLELGETELKIVTGISFPEF